MQAAVTLSLVFRKLQSKILDFFFFKSRLISTETMEMKLFTSDFISLREIERLLFCLTSTPNI